MSKVSYDIRNNLSGNPFAQSHIDVYPDKVSKMTDDELIQEYSIVRKSQEVRQSGKTMMRFFTFQTVFDEMVKRKLFKNN